MAAPSSKPTASLLAAGLGLAAAASFAYPEGAPWGAANPDAQDTCASCHYDYEPVRNSAALEILGLPETARAGREYLLEVRFAPPAARISGFQLVAAAGDADAGAFRSADAAVEAIGSAGRSTSPVAVRQAASWKLRWLAPASPASVRLYLAASAANDDQSPFGDTIHYRQFCVEVEAGE